MRKSQFVARGGMMAATSLALLYLASVLPMGQVGVCAVAGILPAMPLARQRVAFGALVYAATSLLGWLIVPRKSAMLLYSIFGLYCFVKYAAERGRRRAPEWAGKLLFCGGAFLLLLFAAGRGFFPALALPKGALLLLAAALFFLVFIAFDIAFSKLIGFLKRIFPKE